MAKENLLIVISTNDVDTILKFPLLYGGVLLTEALKDDKAWAMMTV